MVTPKITARSPTLLLAPLAVEFDDAVEGDVFEGDVVEGDVVDDPSVAVEGDVHLGAKVKEDVTVGVKVVLLLPASACVHTFSYGHGPLALPKTAHNCVFCPLATGIHFSVALSSTLTAW